MVLLYVKQWVLFMYSLLLCTAAFVRERRPAIFSPSSSQMKNILLFEARFKADAVSGGSLKNV